MRTKTFKQRFEEKFRVTPGCWIWTAGKNNDGYGLIWRDDKIVRANRVSYELYVGPIPDGLIIRHKCDNRSCVNPSHLLTGAHADNMRDAVDRRRMASQKGADNGQSKLTEAQVLAIRSDTRSQVKISADYGVNQSLIWFIKRRKNWTHI